VGDGQDDPKQKLPIVQCPRDEELSQEKLLRSLAIKGPDYWMRSKVLMPTNQEPSLEEEVSTHITLALQYCSVTQIRSPVWKK